MAKLAEPLMGVRNTGKMPNEKVAKVHLFFLFLSKVLHRVQLIRTQQHDRIGKRNCMIWDQTHCLPFQALTLPKWEDHELDPRLGYLFLST